MDEDYSNKGMTWVIGHPTMWGFSLLVSDIQASSRKEDGSYECFDLVQKIHPITNFLALGFAGSIAIGFAMVDKMREHFPAVDGQALIPAYATIEWRKHAIEIFNSYPLDIQAGGCHLILAAVEPNEDNGIPGQARARTIMMKSPDFIPEYGKNVTDLQHIGSGASVNEYQKAVSHVETEGLFSQAILSGTYAVVTQTLLTYTDALQKNPQIGVSQHLQGLVIDRTGFQLVSNDRIYFDPNGNQTHFTMPTVANNYQEFERISKGLFNCETAIA